MMPLLDMQGILPSKLKRRSSVCPESIFSIQQHSCLLTSDSCVNYSCHVEMTSGGSFEASPLRRQLLLIPRRSTAVRPAANSATESDRNVVPRRRQGSQPRVWARETPQPFRCYWRVPRWSGRTPCSIKGMVSKDDRGRQDSGSALGYSQYLATLFGECLLLPTNNTDPRRLVDSFRSTTGNDNHMPITDNHTKAKITRIRRFFACSGRPPSLIGHSVSKGQAGMVSLVASLGNSCRVDESASVNLCPSMLGRSRILPQPRASPSKSVLGTPPE